MSYGKGKSAIKSFIHLKTEALDPKTEQRDSQTEVIREIVIKET
jgi:hypothetical protein